VRCHVELVRADAAKGVVDTMTTQTCSASAWTRRERYVGEWIPEPLPEPAPDLMILERTVNGQPGLCRAAGHDDPDGLL
jgi:hypothetical protein